MNESVEITQHELTVTDAIIQTSINPSGFSGHLLVFLSFPLLSKDHTLQKNCTPLFSGITCVPVEYFNCLIQQFTVYDIQSLEKRLMVTGQLTWLPGDPQFGQSALQS